LSDGAHSMARSDRQPGDGSVTPGVVDVCVIGSINLDLVITASRLPSAGETVLGGSFAEHPGGKGLNQAVASVRSGARTALCACVGEDQAGVELRRVAEAAGLRGEHVSVASGHPTGRALIAVSADTQENLIVVAPGANSALTGKEAVRAIAGARVVLAQLEVPLETVATAFAAAQAANAITILNPAPAEGVTVELLARCDFVVANEHEAELMGGARQIVARGAGQVVVTLGARGSVHTTADGQEHHVEAFAVDAVDSTAAGDAYCGAFAAGVAAGHDVSAAMRFASAAGALATTKAGAVPSLPQRSEIDELLAARAPGWPA
jgi:ribokinase